MSVHICRNLLLGFDLLNHAWKLYYIPVFTITSIYVLGVFQTPSNLRAFSSFTHLVSSIFLLNSMLTKPLISFHILIWIAPVTYDIFQEGQGRQTLSVFFFYYYFLSSKKNYLSWSLTDYLLQDISFFNFFKNINLSFITFLM